MKTTVKGLRRFVQEAMRSDDEDGRLPRAACVLLVKGHEVLVVSRKDDSTDFGLPGGKVDPDENEMAAAKRECDEETGLDCRNMRRLYANFDDEGFWVTTYTADWSGTIHTNESGVVKWADPSVLLQGRFARYNADMLRAAGVLQ